MTTHRRNRYNAGPATAATGQAGAHKAKKSYQAHHREAQKAKTPVAQFPPRPTGKARFTVERFLSDCCEKTRKYLVGQWKQGNQLVARKVPFDGLPPVVILAAYAKLYGVELVDDYDALLDRYRENIEECCHPDKFFSSCILLLADRGQIPSDEAFESINVPNLYEELLP